MEILIIDNDRAMVTMLSYLLADAGYHAITASNGPSGLQAIARRQPALVLLDAVLPTISGFDVCHMIRQTSDVPIIFLSACASVHDRVVGLQIGADDYIAKPFEPADLLARIEAVLRRCRGPLEAPAARISQGGFTLDPLNHRAILSDSRTVDLTPLEFRLLSYLVTNAGRILSPGQILEHVWGRQDCHANSALATYILRLRHKVEPDPANPRHIVTARNLGYKFHTEKPAPASAAALPRRQRAKQLA